MGGLVFPRYKAKRSHANGNAPLVYMRTKPLVTQERAVALQREVLRNQGFNNNIKGVDVMVRFDRLINAIAFGGALLFSNAAFSQAPEYYYFFPFEHVKGLYYAPGTPVLQAQGSVAPVASGAFAGLGAPSAPVISSPPGTPSEPLMTGRSVMVGTIGNHCMTPDTSCLLEHSSIQGKGCSCKIEGKRQRGTVTP